MENAHLNIHLYQEKSDITVYNFRWYEYNSTCNVCLLWKWEWMVETCRLTWHRPRSLKFTILDGYESMIIWTIHGVLYTNTGENTKHCLEGSKKTQLAGLTNTKRGMDNLRVISWQKFWPIGSLAAKVKLLAWVNLGYSVSSQCQYPYPLSASPGHSPLCYPGRWAQGAMSTRKGLAG